MHTRSRQQSASILLLVSISSIINAACSDTKGLSTFSPDRVEATQFALVAETDQHIYSQGVPILVTTTLLVLSEGEATIVYESYGNPMAEYSYTLVDEQGQSVPLTDEGRRYQSAKRSHMASVVQQDQPWRRTFQIDAFFELSQPGTYTLTLAQDVWTSEQIEVIGKPVTFIRTP